MMSKLDTASAYNSKILTSPQSGAAQCFLKPNECTSIATKIERGLRKYELDQTQVDKIKYHFYGEWPMQFRSEIPGGETDNKITFDIWPQVDGERTSYFHHSSNMPNYVSKIDVVHFEIKNEKDLSLIAMVNTTNQGVKKVTYVAKLEGSSTDNRQKFVGFIEEADGKKTENVEMTGLISPYWF